MNKRKTNQAKIRRLAFLALFSALVLLMATTPIGYLNLGPVKITFLAIPVVIGGIVLGPTHGAILGFIFGATSFAQCFGADPLGSALLIHNPVLTAIMCFLPRILIGLFSGLSYKYLSKIITNPKIYYLKYVLPSFIGSVTNSVFFIGFMLLFFWNTPEIQSFGSNVLTVLGVMFTTNVFIEAAVCLFISAALSKVLHIFSNKYNF